jgi:hypothetical protein
MNRTPSSPALFAPSACTLLMIAALVSPEQHAAAQITVRLAPSADVTLYQSATGVVASGSGEHLFSGLTLRGAGERRCIVTFDLTTLPADHTITSASLHMEVTRVNSDRADITLHRVLNSWNEGPSDAGEPGGYGTQSEAGDTTWLHRNYPSILWSNPGGDYVTSASASASNDSEGPITWGTTPALLADLELWRTTPALNHGWLLLTFADDLSSARRFASRENLNDTIRPVLELTLEPSCGTCTADFNCDGGVDGGDVEVFFMQWADAAIQADFNQDGGIDGSDVEAFFSRWEQGC